MGMRRFALDLDVAIFMLLMADAGVVTFLRGVDADAATFCRARHLPAPLRGIVINIGIGRLLRRQCLGLRGGISLKRQRELCDDLGVEKGLEAGQFEEDREARQYPTSVRNLLRKNPQTIFFSNFRLLKPIPETHSFAAAAALGVTSAFTHC